MVSFYFSLSLHLHSSPLSVFRLILPLPFEWICVTIQNSSTLDEFNEFIEQEKTPSFCNQFNQHQTVMITKSNPKNNISLQSKPDEAGLFFDTEMEQSQFSKLLFCKHNSMCHPISFIMLRSNQSLNKNKTVELFFSNLWMAINRKMRPRNLMRKHLIRESYKMAFILNELSVSPKKKEKN